MKGERPQLTQRKWKQSPEIINSSMPRSSATLKKLMQFWKPLNFPD